MAHRIYGMPVAKVYPAYLAKVERKGRTREELDQVICWLTGHDAGGPCAGAGRRAWISSSSSPRPRR